MAVIKHREKLAPPPPAKEMTPKQRMLYNRSGINAKKAILGKRSEIQEEEAPQHKVKHQPSNFASPTDFYTGPSKPGSITTGVRRCEESEVDTVGYMMSDDFFESTDGCEIKKKNLGSKDNVDNVCFPVRPEPPQTTGVKQVKSPEVMDAPYFEDNNPKPPREEDVPHGRKVYPDTHDTSFVYPNPRPYKQPVHGNRKNESVDITNLGRYTREQLHEEPEDGAHYGPVKWHAPGMDYPVRRPAIRQVNGKCNECHDVMGTQRFGRAPEQHNTGVAKVPPPVKDTKNLIPTVPAPQEPTKPIKQDKLLRYYDPTHDDASKFKDEGKVSTVRLSAKGSNANSNSHWVPHGGKGKGTYHRNSKETFQTLA